jgi:uncharacterized repeat protein (TIGR01451 family)
MSAFQSVVRNVFAVSVLLLFFCTIGFAQGKVDLEIKVQTASETARGGETFSYTVTVSNNGSAKAVNVIFIQSESNEADFVSYIPNKGDCEAGKGNSNIERVLRCRLGDIEVGESVTTVISLKINDFDEISENVNLIDSLPTTIKGTSYEHNLSEYVEVYAENGEENREDNSARVFAKLLPSKNKPPRIEIVSPKQDAVFVKPLNKELEVSIVVKAFDADGKIVKVVVSDGSNLKYGFIVENGQIKYVVGGVKYTVEEFEKAAEDERFRNSLETRAELTGRDTYSYTAKNFSYGDNPVFIYAVDDGGRQTRATVAINVKRDASIEIVSPKSEQVFAPNSTITVETISRINDSTKSKLRINGTQKGYFYTDFSQMPFLQETSKAGNTYKHQYIWKNAQEGVYNLTVMLFDGEKPSLSVGDVMVVVAEPRIIKIFSLGNKQEFKQGEAIKISIDATDKKGRVVNDDFELWVNGKYKNTVYNAWETEAVPPYNSVLNKNHGYNLSGLEKGTHTIQVIARRNSNYNREAAILGKSEIYTIKVK